MEIHAASPDVPFNRGGVMFILPLHRGWVVEADHVTAPKDELRGGTTAVG